MSRRRTRGNRNEKSERERRTKKKIGIKYIKNKKERQGERTIVKERDIEMKNEIVKMKDASGNDFFEY